MKSIIVEHIGDFWKIAYSRLEAKDKTIQECTLYTREAVQRLLKADSFASQGSWVAPTGLVSLDNSRYSIIV